MSGPEKRHRQDSNPKLQTKSRKRRRVVGNASSKSHKATISEERRPVGEDELHWKEVDLPDRLEDAEGFLGLEEIEDVEVIREEGGSGVRFMARLVVPLSINATRRVQGDAPHTAASQKTEIEDEDSWSGFEESEPEDGSTTNMSKRPDNPLAQKPSENKGLGSTLSKDVTSNGRLKGLQMEVDPDVTFAVLRQVGNEPEVDVAAWSDLLLTDQMLSAISRLGFRIPTPIQSETIPRILEGHDVIGKAVTGSGKTLAYGIPIFEHYLERKDNLAEPVALVLAPTRELAHQISKHLTDLSHSFPNQPRVVAVTGGLSIHKQLRQLTDADVIIGTPGRLWEVINESSEFLSGLKKTQYLIVDEADRLLSEGHFKEVEQILDSLDREVIDEETNGDDQEKKKANGRQTLVFSATFHKGLQQKLLGKARIAGGDLLNEKQSMEYLLKKLNFREKKPTFIDVNPTSQMAKTLNEAILECGAMEKDLYLYFLLLQNPNAKTLVFANSISSVKRLVPLFQNLNLPTVALHSTMPQKARLRSLERFSAQRSILVSTDVAARGLDIKNIDLIIHYHVPRTADMYVHRSGRTARAENRGRSILLCSPDEVVAVTRLIGKIHSGFELETIHADRGIIVRLEPRLKLSQRITDATLSKEKAGTRDDWLRTAAAELGVDYDSEDFAAEGTKNKRGRGSKSLGGNSITSKSEIASMRAQLMTLLQKRVNLGISERYLAGGKVNVDALLEGTGDQTFLGRA